MAKKPEYVKLDLMPTVMKKLHRNPTAANAIEAKCWECFCGSNVAPKDDVEYAGSKKRFVLHQIENCSCNTCPIWVYRHLNDKTKFSELAVNCEP
jgi:hypothetical protein